MRSAFISGEWITEADVYEGSNTFICCGCNWERDLGLMEEADDERAYCRYCVNDAEPCTGCDQLVTPAELDEGGKTHEDRWCKACCAISESIQEKKERLNGRT